MTIDKAIYELEEGMLQLRGYLHKDYNNAIKLGIEALKAVKDYHGNPDFDCSKPLPGETKE